MITLSKGSIRPPLLSWSVRLTNLMVVDVVRPYVGSSSSSLSAYSETQEQLRRHSWPSCFGSQSTCPACPLTTLCCAVQGGQPSSIPDPEPQSPAVRKNEKLQVRYPITFALSGL
jgi:hypothetical protein